MITKTFSTITKEITAKQIWELMTDVNNWKRWDTSVDFSELHGEFKAGTFFTLKPKGGPKVKIQLVEVRSYSYFKDLTRFPLAKMYGEHWYENTPLGLKITVTMSISGLLAFLWYFLVMKGIVDNLPKDLKAQISEAKKL